MATQACCAHHAIASLLLPTAPSVRQAGKIPDSMAKAAVIMPAPGEGDATEVGVTVQPKKPKRVGPPCCCIQ